MNRTLEMALALARAGFLVFPCRAHDRRPATINGFKDATTDEPTIRRWFENNPHLNLAISCGPQPNGLNLVAIDVDAQSGGLEAWAEWTDDHAVPVTARHETPSGGFHLFFDAPSELRVGRDQLAPGIDVRASGGYVVAPPSLAPSKTTGEILAYRTRRETFVGLDGNVAAMPLDMFEALAPASNGHVPPSSIERHPSSGRRGVSLRVIEGDSVADLARVGWVWEDELEADGWTFVRHSGGDSQWTRPDKNPRDGTSATLHNDGDGPLVVWSTSLPSGGKPTEGNVGESYSPWDYIVTFRCHGDTKVAARLVRGVSERSESRPERAAGEAALADQPTALYLPDDFWSATVLLSEVRRIALSRLRTPDAVLAALLTMYATTIPMGIWLPDIVGAPAPLNLFGVIVGRSGGGKTSAMTIAADLMGSPANADILLRKQLRSGEGLITLVNKPGRKGKGDEPDEPPSTRVGVHVHYDEGGTLSKQSQQTASTIIPYLNTAWSGAGTVGGALRDGDSGFDASRVRICALIGVQYGIGANLFTGEAARLGFPQRLLFLSADEHPAVQDQEMPDEQVEIEPMGLPFLRHSDYVSHRHFVEIPRHIRQEVWDWSKTRPDPLDGHLMNLRLRIASVLMLMHGAGDTDFEPWWHLASMIQMVHNDVRHTFISSHGKVSVEQDEALGRSLGRRKEAEYEYHLDRAVQSLLTKLSRGPLPTRAVKDHFKSWGKRYGFAYREVLDRAALLGLVVETASGWAKV